MEIAGLGVNLSAFDSRGFGQEDEKPFKDFEAFFRVMKGRVESWRSG
jgi:hypothetical protein